MPDKQQQDRQTHQGTTPEQRAQILRTVDRATNGQTRTQPNRTH